jgi:hypothetical protein
MSKRETRSLLIPVTKLLNSHLGTAVALSEKEAGPADFAPQGPLNVLAKYEVTRSTDNATRDQASQLLVSCALRDDDEVDAAVGLFLSLFR